MYMYIQVGGTVDSVLIKDRGVLISEVLVLYTFLYVHVCTYIGQMCTGVQLFTSILYE